MLSKWRSKFQDGKNTVSNATFIWPSLQIENRLFRRRANIFYLIIISKYMRRRKDDEIFTSYVARLWTEICQTRTYSRTLMMINVLNEGIIFSRIVNCFVHCYHYVQKSWVSMMLLCKYYDYAVLTIDNINTAMIQTCTSNNLSLKLR